MVFYATIVVQTSITPQISTYKKLLKKKENLGGLDLNSLICEFDAQNSLFNISRKQNAAIVVETSVETSEISASKI